MELFAWCILPSHAHMIFRDKNQNPSNLIMEFKTYTSKKLQGIKHKNGFGEKYHPLK
jgi:REP element-mobilizing transposase RayT